MGNHNSRDGDKARENKGRGPWDFILNLFPPEQEPEPAAPRPPKHMLWGCSTAEEHFKYIEEFCEKATAQSTLPEAKLRELGFEFKFVEEEPFDSHLDENVFKIEYDLSEAANHNVTNENDEGEYTVPIGVPLRKSLSTHMLVDDDSSPKMSRSTSAVSLFSLDTHYSMASSNISDDFGSRKEPSDQPYCACGWRLHHIASGGTMITKENHKSFIAHGKMHDVLAQLCMEYAQEIMIREGKLKWVSIKNEDNNMIGALVNDPPPCQQEQATLLIITGKGQVRAGIFSRRLLMTNGVEAATALPFIREATKRSMKVILLDPNAQGWRMAMKVVEHSLEKIFLQGPLQNEEIYVLAHSMAGSQLVRFLQNKTNPVACVDQDSKMTGDDKENPVSAAALSFFRRIKAVAFTDSNHNINWAKNNAALQSFLGGSGCLYVKSHKVHDDAKALGELHHDCHFWRHRFGDVRTIWAGTNEHALTNYIARWHIWDHFDTFLDNEDSDIDYQ